MQEEKHKWIHVCSRRPALDDILKGAKNKKESESLSAACYDMESMDTGYNGYNMYMIREMTNNIIIFDKKIKTQTE